MSGPTVVTSSMCTFLLSAALAELDGLGSAVHPISLDPSPST